MLCYSVQYAHWNKNPEFWVCRLQPSSWCIVTLRRTDLFITFFAFLKAKNTYDNFLTCLFILELIQGQITAYSEDVLRAGRENCICVDGGGGVICVVKILGATQSVPLYNGAILPK